ncbi:hypothetical protein, partial [Sphingobacterium multivorum]|uniref:hypothetical protein n=1 Tax=Sphingobacterium multivorum TaxID=28454 RepID=UPI002FDEA844
KFWVELQNLFYIFLCLKAVLALLNRNVVEYQLVIFKGCPSFRCHIGDKKNSALVDIFALDVIITLF